MTMLLWLYAISGYFSAMTLLRRKGVADRRALVSVIAVGAVSTVGVLVPKTELVAFWAGTAGFVILMLVPGLLVRLGRYFAGRGSFHPAGGCLNVAVILFPAAGFRAERDLYRALRDNGGIQHPAAADVRARIAAMSPQEREYARARFHDEVMEEAAGIMDDEFVAVRGRSGRTGYRRRRRR